jgi:hypothetical protein
MPTGAAPIERVDAVMARPPGNVVVSADECFRAATDHLLIKKPKLVVARVTETVAKEWSVFELPDGRWNDVLQR